MTARELTITKAVLNYLHELDYAQASSVQIQLAVNTSPLVAVPKPSVAELDCVLRHCDVERWIAGVPGRFNKQMRWNITEAGEAARVALNE